MSYHGCGYCKTWWKRTHHRRCTMGGCVGRDGAPQEGAQAETVHHGRVCRWETRVPLKSHLTIQFNALSERSYNALHNEEKSSPLITVYSLKICTNVPLSLHLNGNVNEVTDLHKQNLLNYVHLLGVFLSLSLSPSVVGHQSVSDSVSRDVLMRERQEGETLPERRQGDFVLLGCVCAVVTRGRPARTVTSCTSL